MTVHTLSAEALRELFAQYSGHVLLPLVTFDHADLTDPIRIVANTQDITHDGNTYTALPFELTLPTDSEDEIPSVELTLDNIDRTLVEILRSTNEPADVSIEIVRVDDEGAVASEIGPLDFSLLDARITAHTITLRIGYLTDILNEAATKDIFSPALAPGLYA